MAGAPTLDGTPSFLNPVQVPVSQTQAQRSQITRDEFFKLMIAELRNQDPLEPLDNQQFLAQLTQLEMLNGQSTMTQGVNSLVDTLRFGQLNDASSMLGKIVTAKTMEPKFDSKGDPVVDVNGNQVREEVPVQGLATRVGIRDGKTNIVLLVPVLDPAGNPVFTVDGELVTREVTVPASAVVEITDPMVNAPEVEGEDNGDE